jgi:hypothetical protein
MCRCIATASLLAIARHFLGPHAGHENLSQLITLRRPYVPLL